MGHDGQVKQAHHAYQCRRETKIEGSGVPPRVMKSRDPTAYQKTDTVQNESNGHVRYPLFRRAKRATVHTEPLEVWHKSPS